MPRSKKSPTLKQKPLFLEETPALPAWSLPEKYATYEKPWDGSPFTSRFLALDTETDLVDLRREVPRVVLGSASDGRRHALLGVGQLPVFLLAHRNKHFIFWNSSFDYWVIRKVLETPGQEEALKAWDDALDAGRLHDAMLMEQLVRIAEGRGESGGAEKEFFRLNLGAAAREYNVLEPPKDEKSNPWRLRYAELFDLPGGVFSSCEQGFYDYAVADVIATSQLWSRFRPRALELSQATGVSEECRRKYGLLTEQIQVKAAVAFAKLQRNGAPFDAERARSLRNATLSQYRESQEWMEEHHPDLFKRFKKKNDGGYKLSKRTGLPEFNLKPMRAQLSQLAAEKGLVPPRSKGKLGLVSASADDWEPYRKESEFVDRWLSMRDSQRHLAFFKPFEEAEAKGLSRVHPQYNTLVRTGRASCRNPNAQQCPKGSDFRTIIRLTGDKKLYTVDYGFVELRTFAAICLSRFGWSHMADVIKQGKDPHSHTGSLVSGVPYEELHAWATVEKGDPRRDDPRHKEYKHHRNSAKACNFGLIGGLGAPNLAAYARANYGVAMTVEEAAVLRNKMLNEIYPEMGLYLADSTADDLGIHLRIPKDVLQGYCETACKTLFRSPPEKLGMFFYCLGQCLKGKATSKRTGQAYQQDFQEKLLFFLKGILELCPRRKDFPVVEFPSPDLYDSLFSQTAITLTGRVRSGCGYTNSRNTPFQGLAADGAKLALYDLIIQKGFKVVLFVHDEVVVELDAQSAEEDRKVIDEVMVHHMEAVMENRVPAACGGVLSECWEKG